MIIILSVIIVLILIYKYAWPANKYWERRGLPAYKIKMFLSMKNVVHQIGEVYKKMKVEGQSIAGLYLTWEKVLFIADLQLLGILIPYETEIPWNSIDYEAQKKELFEVIIHSAKKLVLDLQGQTISEKTDIDFIGSTLWCTSEIITSIVFGADFHHVSKLAPKMLDMTLRAVKCSLKLIVKRLIIQWLPKLAMRFKINPQDSTARKFFVETVREAVEYRKQNTINPTSRHDFLQRLQDAENTDGEKIPMTDEEIAENIMSVFVSGVETSAVIVGYSLVEIKCNSIVEHELRDEICAVLARNSYNFNIEALEEMTYLDAVVRETLRMYPPVPIFRRKCNNNVTLYNNIEVERGTTIAISLLALQDSEKFSGVEFFNPDRIKTDAELEQEEKITSFLNHSNALIDYKLLVLQCKIILALIIWNFDYQISEKTSLPLALDAPNGILVSNCIWLNFSPLITSL